MAEVILFVTGQSEVFEEENRESEQNIRAFCSWMLGENFSIAVYCKGEDYNSIFKQHKDCRFVFAKSADLESLHEATKRGLIVFESQPQKTFLPVRVTRVNHRGYKKIPFGI